ncbi:hypothetical protein OSB04_010735 [Centaurea solstitialis]|uniref:SWIM-type domain-containing protein n=1 Tax=Centaurea solstitialis TaxID=347529 RepID=A0AA38TIW1_9ASTR|nr:hypothetical protein OSB04_010735 [Centaurea solstitialis]
MNHDKEDTGVSDIAIIEEFIEDENNNKYYETADCNIHTEFQGLTPGIDAPGETQFRFGKTVSKSSAATHEIIVSPSGKNYWVPHAPPHVKLAIGDDFASIDEADVAYRRYAEEVGFDVRQSTRKKNKDGNVQNHYLFCSREGVPVKHNFDSLGSRSSVMKLRRSNVKRTGCKARVKFRYRKEDARYVIYKLEEKHNHKLYDSNDKRFARSRRQLKYTDYRNIYNAAGSSIGGSRCHSIQSAFKGGIEYIGATPSDYNNARRDMIAYVGIKDAQMIIDLLAKHEISRLNYKEFGDAISFDATYRTNRHAMNFVSFIAIDNHKRSVVVGAALISHEDTENYEWVLKAFLQAHSNQPKFVITDQCPSMKEAIPKVFTEAKHRLCTWHIMKKLPGQLSKELNANATFKKRIKRLVWSPHVTVEEFETEWVSIINDYELHHNKWLADKFEIRHSWICAYIKDEPMSGLMRTTSRLENSHAYFRLFASFRNDIVRAFDGAIDKQRNIHSCIEFANRNTFPRCATPLPIERHASEMFTRVIFFDIQKEIRKAVYFCGLELESDEEDVKTYKISHNTKTMRTTKSYQVVQHESTNTYICKCNMFTRIGMVCCHILKVLINDGIHTIPDSFISRRWTRALVPVQIEAARIRYGEIDVEKEQLINGMHANIDLIISRLRNDKAKSHEASEDVVGLKKKALKECYGVDAPAEPDVLPPAGLCNKGSGKGKRLKGAIEKAVEKSIRPKRQCKVCEKFAHHDSRNCPLRDK